LRVVDSQWIFLPRKEVSHEFEAFKTPLVVIVPVRGLDDWDIFLGEPG
jgi:hypothetical protein